MAVEEREREAEEAFLTGRLEDAVQAWTSAHTEALQAGEVARAVRAGFWASFALLNNGDLARGGGWVDRGRHLLDEHALDVVERGYLTYCSALRAIFGGDVAAAHAGFVEAVATGKLYGDRQLTTLAQVGLGRCTIYLGQVAEGVALLDEAMVSVSAREISPIAVGDTYCTVIDGCQELFDLHRVREWTTAFSRWCDERPDVLLYHGHCLMHRAEIMQLRGEWQDAVDEADRACARLVSFAGGSAVGAALYLRAELHRLRGEHDKAELVYERAHGAGRDPQPGLALLRLGQGRTDVARAAIDRALADCEDPVSRCRLLAAHVEISLAAADLDHARQSAEDLGEVAEQLQAPYLRAQAASVTGAVQLDLGDAATAASTLRRAVAAWNALEAPYETARTRVLLASAYRLLGDGDGERLELNAAARTFKELGAAPDLARLETPVRDGGPLSPREIEVLRLVARGRSNRAIAESLVISEKTVARHLSNIFTKLGLSSRSAATAYAYEHGLTG